MQNHSTIIGLLFGLLFLSTFATAADPTANSGVAVPVVSTTVPSMVGIGLIVIAIVLLYLFRNVIVNTVLGFIALALLSLVGITVPLNILTVIVIAVLGLAGVGILVLLSVFKLI